MLAESDGDVLVLPATTRYESPGGGSETSTERRIIFSPEVPGRRIGSAKPEWWVFREVLARLDPSRRHLVGLRDAAAIRQEIARTTPLYSGIETFAAKGDQVQWGGRTLYADGRFATPDGKAHFAAVSLAPASRPADAFVVSTRRGKQFNSMVQREVDPLTGAGRHDIFMSAADMERLQLQEGAAVRLRSPSGTFDGDGEAGLDQAWQSRGALARRDAAAGRQRDRSRFDGTRLQRHRPPGAARIGACAAGCPKPDEGVAVILVRCH